MNLDTSGRPDVRVMTYNILVDTGADGPDAWPQRADSVAGVVRVDRPDFVGFQEARAGQFADLRERLEGYEWVGEGRRGGEEGEFCPVGYRADRFELLAAETFWLSETPEVPGSVAWDTAYPRIATVARVEERATGTELVVANTHLDNASARARREGAALVRDRLVGDEDTAPVVLCGDFNCEPGSEPYRLLTGRRAGTPPLRDAREATQRSPLGPSVTFPGFTDPTSGRCIDHVFVSEGVEVIQHVTRTATRENGQFPSDHLPVVVDLDPNGGASGSPSGSGYGVAPRQG